ncbi:MAG: ABC transporter permease subunit [Clostridiales bacterium]|nr:ABC transporter permease subunit [Clostridiales bacterium]
MGLKKRTGFWTDAKEFIIRYRFLHLMILPCVLYFAVFKYAPMYGVVMAFKNYDAVGGFLGIMQAPWVGFDNFLRFFNSIYFKRLLGNTVLISIYRLLFSFSSPIVMAILINEIKNTHFKRIVQTITYMPHFLSWVIVSGLLIVLCSPSSGAVAGLFKAFGMEPIYFLSDTRYFRPMLVISEIWKSVGWGTIIYLAAITGIDQEIYEAATIDGASRLQKIFRITVPQLSSIISIMFILAVGRILDENFEQIFNMYNPAVYEVADVFETYVYRTGILSAQYSYSAAVGLFKSFVSLILVLSSNQLAHLLGNEGLW